MKRPRSRSPRGDSAPAVLLYVAIVGLVAAVLVVLACLLFGGISNWLMLTVLCALSILSWPARGKGLAGKTTLSFASILYLASVALVGSPRCRAGGGRLSVGRPATAAAPATRLQRGDEHDHRRLRRLRVHLGRRRTGQHGHGAVGPDPARRSAADSRRPGHVPGQCVADVGRDATLTGHPRPTVRGHHAHLIRPGLRRLRSDRLLVRRPLGARRGRALQRAARAVPPLRRPVGLCAVRRGEQRARSDAARPCRSR